MQKSWILTIWDVLTHLDQVNLGFNKGTLNKLLEFTRMIKSFRKRLQEMEAFDLAYTIANETGIIRDLQSDKTPENVSRFENIEELLNGIKDFTDDREREGDLTLAEYLQEVTLMTDADQEKEEDRNKVTIMTIHSAKGLEFKHLIIAGVEEELFPSQMSIGQSQGSGGRTQAFLCGPYPGREECAYHLRGPALQMGYSELPVLPAVLSRRSTTKYLELPPDFYPVLPGNGIRAEKEKFVPEPNRKFRGRKQSSRIQAGSRRLVNVNQAFSLASVTLLPRPPRILSLPIPG